jgi:hypothetical protein
MAEVNAANVAATHAYAATISTTKPSEISAKSSSTTSSCNE